MTIRAVFIVLLGLAACAPMPSDFTPVRIDFPPMARFETAPSSAVTRPNSEIALDFVDLAFQLESGRELPALTRFEGPVTVAVNGPLPEISLGDLDDLLGRLRREARIDITQVPQSESASIVINAIPARQLQRLAPNAACFVVPRTQDLPSLRRARYSPQLDWARLQTREKVGIFIPADSTPQEIRDCLHEELAQALGPLNDLYRLPDSVFNDDNMHAVLTGFDMLILRAFYAPELRSGMSKAQVSAALPRILRRINPRGERAGGQIPSSTSREWIDAVETALGDRASNSRRRAAAAQAVSIGQIQGWTGPREGFANYIFGRLQVGRDATLALGAFSAAARSYRQTPQTDIHAAHVAVQLAAFALIAGDAEAVLAQTTPAIPIARRHQNAALLALLMMFEAEALDLQGDTEAGMALRLDSLGWALYGFGSRDAVIDRLNEIASLPPRSAKAS